MKTINLLLSAVVSMAVTACTSAPSEVKSPDLTAAKVETQGCYYAGQVFSVGAIKPSMTAVATAEGGVRLIDDPKTAVPLQCVVQFDGVHKNFVWITVSSAS
jgi:hypothetical protein